KARLIALAAAAVAVAALVLLILPACADDVTRPAGGAGLSTWVVAVLGAAAGVALALRDAGRRAAWALVAGIILLSLGVGLVSGGERVVLPATVIATLPIAGFALSVARGAKGAAAALAIVVGFFLGSTLMQSAAFEGIARLGAPSDVSGALSTDMPCFTPAAAATAAALPPGLVLAPAAIGPDILYLTPHSVRASPFGRNAEDNRVVAGLFAAVPEEAHRQSLAIGGTYLFFCRTGAGTAESDSLSAMLERGEVPPWLVPVPADEEARVRLFRILPEG
ncbi:MAG TPA: hypothetical protein PKA74_19530, partial [Bauldia sp.]|nr:hypothetical protein [Bauldia sp.]